METVTFFDGTVLHIEDAALAKLFRHIQGRKTDKEAGGILLGKCFKNREEYIITDISEPNTKDKRTRFSFIRNKSVAQRIINEKWNETNGVMNYLGEWHTHPETTPIPSQVDRNLIRQVINDHSNVFEKVFLVIVGMNKSLYIGMADSKICGDIIFSEYTGDNL